jgi:small-conductance mechanosensitive channel/CRP-like cAMP-binding protein
MTTHTTYRRIALACVIIVASVLASKSIGQVSTQANLKEADQSAKKVTEAAGPEKSPPSSAQKDAPTSNSPSLFVRVLDQLWPLGGEIILGLLVLLVLLGLKRLFRNDRELLKRIRLPWRILLGYLVLVSSAIAESLYWPQGYRLTHMLSLFVLVIGVLQALIVVTLDVFFERGRKILVPVIVRNVIAIVLYLVGCVIIMRYYGIDLTGILTGSIVLTAILGFALQDTLGSIASGLAIQIERPYHEYDWVRFGDELGQVLEINWRATQLLNLDNEVVVIPNKLITADRFWNLSRPNPIIRRTITVGLPYDGPPNRSKQILAAAAQASGVLSDPAPYAVLSEFSDSALSYDVHFFIRDIRQQERIDDRVRTNIWYRIKRAGLSIPFPIRDITVRQVEEGEDAIREERAIARRLQALQKIPFLSPLAGQEKEDLANRMRDVFYGSGETVIQQGDEGDSLFFIRSGEVEVLLGSEITGSPRRVALIGPGDFFGEMSLMTGERRAATIRTLTDAHFYVIEAFAFRQILADHEEICFQIAEILEERQVNLEEKREEYEATAPKHTATAEEGTVLDRIRSFFGL